MTHSLAIVAAFGLTFTALAIEVLLLLLRRRRAERQMRESAP